MISIAAFHGNIEAYWATLQLDGPPNALTMILLAAITSGSEYSCQIVPRQGSHRQV